MNVRRATEADLPVVRGLWEAFETEVPEPLHREQSLEEEWPEIPAYLESGLILLAEAGGSAVGYALAKLESPRICYLSDVYVTPEARHSGVAKALIAEVVSWGAERGAQVCTLEVLFSNRDARIVYDRLGFVEESVNLFAPLDELVDRLQRHDPAPSYGSIHVQTDDVDGVVKSVEIYVPRLPGGSKGSVVSQPRNGWITIYDELCDRDPEMLRRLALDISNRMAPVVLLLGVEEEAVVRYVLVERGRIVDEYVSVPEYYGPLPPGDVVGLGANPTVAHRLTGADPARVREVARIAESTSELPPVAELVTEIATLLGVEGAEYGYAKARELPGAVVIDR